MIRLVFTFIMFAVWFVACLPTVFAGSLHLAVYNDGRVLVRDVRSMDLPADGEVLFTGVPETIRADSLAVRSLTAPKKFLLLEAGYRYDRADAATLLERYVGKELTVILPDPASTDGRISRKAVLLQAGPMPVFDVDGKIYVGAHEAVILPKLPDDVDREPTLRWKVRNRGPARQDLEVSYLADGMGWKADYALVLDGSRGALTAWASIDNRSGMSFQDARVKLVAGSVNQVRAQPRMYKAEARMTMSMDAAPVPEVRGIDEYHLYELPSLISLGGNESRQVRLFSAAAVPVETELVSRFSVSIGQRTGNAIRQQVESYLAFTNGEKQGLGIPMPAGIVRAYRKDVDGGALLVGETNMRHTPNGELVRLKMGNAFDVSVERVQTKYRKTGKRSATMTWEITVRNGSKVSKRLMLQEMIHGQWKLSDATMKYRKVSSGLVEFDLLLPPGKGATTVRYTVDVSS